MSRHFDDDVNVFLTRRAMKVAPERQLPPGVSRRKVTFQETAHDRAKGCGQCRTESRVATASLLKRK
jgi:hypothetical protein